MLLQAGAFPAEDPPSSWTSLLPANGFVVWWGKLNNWRCMVMLWHYSKTSWVESVPFKEELESKQTYIQKLERLTSIRFKRCWNIILSTKIVCQAPSLISRYLWGWCYPNWNNHLELNGPLSVACSLPDCRQNLPVAMYCTFVWRDMQRRNPTFAIIKISLIVLLLLKNH